MKDDLTALLEAIRLVRAELQNLEGQPGEDASGALARISAIVDQPYVLRAIERLDPMGEAPSITPSLPKATRVN